MGNLKSGNKVVWDNCFEFDFERDDIRYLWGYDDTFMEIYSRHDTRKCWTVKHGTKSKNKVIVIKKCSFKTSKFELRDGKIWLKSTYNPETDSHIYHDYKYCVPFEGEGRPLKTRLCYDDLA